MIGRSQLTKSEVLYNACMTVAAVLRQPANFANKFGKRIWQRVGRHVSLLQSGSKKVSL